MEKKILLFLESCENSNACKNIEKFFFMNKFIRDSKIEIVPSQQNFLFPFEIRHTNFIELFYHFIELWI